MSLYLSNAFATTLVSVILLLGCSDRAITPPSGPLAPATLTSGIATQAKTSPGASVDTGPLSNGGNHTGSISAVGQTDVWTFTAAQGQLLVVSMGEVTGSADFTPWIRLQDPNGAVIASNTGPAAAQIAVSAPLTGTYSVLASTNDVGFDGTGTYTLMAAQLQGTIVVSPGDEGGPVTNGANHRGAIGVGDLDLWTFSANAGDAIILAIGDSPQASPSPPDFVPWIRLVSPTGAVVGAASNVAAAQISVSAPVTGTYTVIVGTKDSGFDATGHYSLTLARAPGVFTITPGDQGGPMAKNSIYTGHIRLGDLDAYTFTASQSDIIALLIRERVVTPEFRPWIRLITPAGVIIASSAGDVLAEISVTAPVTGTYTVVVSTRDAGLDATGHYEITVR